MPQVIFGPVKLLQEIQVLKIALIGKVDWFH